MKLRLTDNGLVDVKLSTSQLFDELCKNAGKPLHEHEPWVSDSFQRLILHPNVLLPTLDHNLHHVAQLFDNSAIGGGVVLIDAADTADTLQFRGYVLYLQRVTYHANGGSFSVEYFQLNAQKTQPYFNSYDRKKTIDELLKTL